jgi:2-haloacid dehalogenase
VILAKATVSPMVSNDISNRAVGTTLSPPPLWLTFDCYGTLIDWESGIRRAFRELCRVVPEEEEELLAAWEQIQWKQIQGPYAPYAEILQSSFHEAAEQFGLSCAPHAEQSFLNSVAQWEPFPDVNPALAALSKRYKLAVISNIDRELLGWTLRQFKIRFDALITAEDAKCYKPNPEVFRYALGRLGCSAEQIAHVAFGAEYDLAAAGALGFRLVYVNRKRLPRPDVALEAEIQTLDQLITLWPNRPAAAAGARPPQPPKPSLNP